MSPQDRCRRTPRRLSHGLEAFELCTRQTAISYPARWSVWWIWKACKSWSIWLDSTRWRARLSGRVANYSDGHSFAPNTRLHHWLFQSLKWQLLLVPHWFQTPFRSKALSNWKSPKVTFYLSSPTRRKLKTWVCSCDCHFILQNSLHLTLPAFQFRALYPRHLTQVHSFSLLL